MGLWKNILEKIPGKRFTVADFGVGNSGFGFVRGEVGVVEDTKLGFVLETGFVCNRIRVPSHFL